MLVVSHFPMMDWMSVHAMGTHPSVAVAPVPRLIAAGVRVAGAEILAVCVRIELGAVAGVVNDLLSRGRAGKRCGRNEPRTNQSEFHPLTP